MELQSNWAFDFTIQFYVQNGCGIYSSSFIRHQVHCGHFFSTECENKAVH